jgi:hypothetical protein
MGEGFIKYAVEMGSGAMILHTRFYGDWFRHSKLYTTEFTDTQTAY